MRRGFGVFGLVMAAILLVIVGVIAYNVGWSDGVSTHLPAGAAAAPQYYYGYRPHAFGWGFGIFGLLFFLFFVFFLFGLMRFAFFGRRMWGGGWGPGYGSHGHGMPPANDERMHEWHRQAHSEAPATPPPPPPDQRPA